MGDYVSLLARPGWLHPTWEIRDCTAGAMTRADESNDSSLGELHGLHGGALKAWEVRPVYEMGRKWMAFKPDRY